MASARRPDPYETLGVSATASDADVRAAYHRLVQLHHPDHNGGSPASARRFEEIQEAYAQVRQRRAGGAATSRTSPPRATRTNTRQPPPRPADRPAARPAARPVDPAADPRLAAMEREIREAQLARERAQHAAREAAAAASASAKRPSDEELGYVTTDDSLSKILADARAQASERFSEVSEPVAKRVADLLDELAAKLGGDQPPRPD